MQVSTEFKQQLARRQYNHEEWVSALVAGDANVASFPYRPMEKGRATISDYHCPVFGNTMMPTPAKDETVYLIAVPIVLSNCTDGHAHLSRNIKAVIDESFGKTAVTSQKAVAHRIACVVGYNCMFSLDSEVNRARTNYMQQLPQVDQLALRILWFMWKPQWRTTLDPHRAYDVEKAYRLLKVVSPQKAEALLRYLETAPKIVAAYKAQIPYQDIRETIKNHAATEEIVAHLRLRAPQSDIYLASLDGEQNPSLRNGGGLGLYSWYDLLLDIYGRKRKMHVVSTGYRAPDTEGFGMQCAVRGDMVGRQAMAHHFTNAPYFLEPNVIFYLNPEVPLTAYSFIGGSSARCESLRFIQNGIASGLIDPEAMLFSPDGGGVATDMGRFRTKVLAKYANCTPKQFCSIKFLKALHGIPQTHTFAHEWAERIYTVIPSVGSKTDTTTPMMSCYGCYDPIKVLNTFCQTVWGRYHSSEFHRWYLDGSPKSRFERYAKLLCLANDEKIEQKADAFASLFFDRLTGEFASAVGFFKAQRGLIVSMKSKMKDLGHSAEVILRIELAAFSTGYATALWLHQEYVRL
jgi:hypothetical protein